MLDDTIYNLNNSFPIPLHRSGKEEEKVRSCKEPEFWGPKLWAFIHSGTRNYPNNPSSADKKAMIAWIKTLGVMIPCEKCQVHYAKNIRKVEGDLNQICSNRKNLFTFFVNLHNVLNDLKGKKKMSVEEAYQMYA